MRSDCRCADRKSARTGHDFGTSACASDVAHPVMFGRDFTDDDGTPNAVIPPPAPGQQQPAQQAPPPPRLPTIGIISYDFWQRAFGGDPSIVGKTISLPRTGARFTAAAALL